ncbi:MAG: sugar ABC transporter permease [Myxococcaceae bacterium]|nr:sugar ABC transporter permease [Myxococcaceae bacterium]
MRRASPLSLWLINLVLIFVCAITLYPALWVVKLAFSEGQAISLSPSPLPDHFSFQHFIDLVGHVDSKGRWIFGRQLFSSLLVASTTTLIGLALAVSAAYALSRFRFPAREAGMQTLLITQMFPATLMLVPLYSLLQRLGLLNTRAGLVLVYATASLPFCVWMLKGYFDAMPKELEEAAMMDGASPLQVFWKVVLPLARPAIAVTGLFSFMTAWNEYILAATLLNDEALFTLPVALNRFVDEYKSEYGTFAAGALLVSIPVMALFYALQKHLVGGLTAGGVKG